jgi:hypothetical protein
MQKVTGEYQFIMKSTVFWNVAPCGFIITDVSEERNDSIFTVGYNRWIVPIVPINTRIVEPEESATIRQWLCKHVPRIPILVTSVTCVTETRGTFSSFSVRTVSRELSYRETALLLW